MTKKATPVTTAPSGENTGIAATTYHPNAGGEMVAEAGQPELIPLALTPIDPAEFAAPGKIPVLLSPIESAEADPVGPAVFTDSAAIKAWVRREISLRGHGHTEDERAILNP